METFSTRQTAVIASPLKTVSWLFRITDNLFNTYYWSTGTQASSGSETVLSGALMAPGSYTGSEWERAHTFKIMNFSGITLRRGKSESGIHAPNDVSFAISNKDNALDAANFKGGTVRIGLVIDDGSGKELCGSWRFRIKSASPYAQQIDVTCEDFLQEYLRGSYPNTRLVDDIFPNVLGTVSDNVCMPEPYGTCYIPVRSVYAGSDRYYILGPAQYSYTIDAVRSPRELGPKIEWPSAGFAFPQSTATDSNLANWRQFQPIIADSDNDGVVDASGLWMSGNKILDMPTKFSRSDSRGDLKTNRLLYSEMFIMGAWVATGTADANANETTAPDGTLTADLIEGIVDGQTNYLYQAVYTGITNGTRYEPSVYIKKVTASGILHLWNPGNPSKGEWTVDLSLLGSGWERLTRDHAAVTVVSEFVGDTGYCGLGFLNADPSVPLSFYLWGAQLEDGTTSSPYIETSSAAVSAYVINPANVIRTVLRNMGLLDYDLDLPSFDAAKATFQSWRLYWNFAFWYKEDRAKVLSRLLAMCHSCLVIGERVKLQVLSKASQATVTNAIVLKMGDVAQDTFRYMDAIAERVSDSGYVAFQKAGESQDQFIRVLVPAKTTTNVIDSEVLTLPGVQDTQQVQKLGTLYYQRKLLKVADISFSGKGTLLALRPDDVITIDYADYGGTYDVLIDEITITQDVSVVVSAIRFSGALDDWDDLSPGAITVVDEGGITTAYTPIITGPDSVGATVPPNLMPGRLRVGDGTSFVLIDPATPLRISVYADGTEVMRFGNLNGFLGYVSALYGIAVGDATKSMKYDPSNGLRVAGEIILTDNIQDNAVTVPVSAYTEGNVAMAFASPYYNASTTYASGDHVESDGLLYYSLQNNNTGHAPPSSPTWWTRELPTAIQSLIITTHGQPVTIFASFLPYGGAIWWGLFRNDTMIAPSYVGSYFYALDTATTFIFTDSPPEGSYTYSIRIWHTDIAGGQSAYNRSLFAIEVRK